MAFNGNGYLSDQIRIMLARVNPAKTLSEAKKLLRILASDFYVVLFTVPIDEWFDSTPGTELLAALQSSKVRNETATQRRRASKCVLDGIGQCKSKGSIKTKKLKKHYAAISAGNFEPWIQKVGQSNFITPFADDADKVLAEYFAIAEATFNCVEEELLANILCNDLRKAKKCVPAIVSRCLDDD
jgi:hypothetical protein